MSNSRTKAILLGVGTLLSLLASGAVKAETRPAAIVISPFLQSVSINASEATKSFPVEITNNTKVEQAFSLSAVDFGALDETGGLVFMGANADALVKKYGLASWLQLPVTSLQIQPGKKATITATIVNDNSFTPGGHYAAIVASVDNKSGEISNSIAFKQKLSSLVFATKVGGESYDLSLSSISHDASWRSLPKKVSLLFKNQGNVHVVPRGTVELVDISGRVVSRGIINEASSYVLPERSRRLDVELKSMGKSVSLPGVYQLKAVYRYEGYEEYAEKSVRISYIPWASIAILSVIVIGLGITVLKFLPHVRRQLRRRRK